MHLRERKVSVEHVGGGEGLGDDDMACFSLAIRTAGLSLATWVFDEGPGAWGRWEQRLVYEALSYSCKRYDSLKARRRRWASARESRNRGILAVCKPNLDVVQTPFPLRCRAAAAGGLGVNS